MPDKQADPEFLKNEAYRDASSLDTRTEIQDRHSSRPQGWFQWVFEHLQAPELAFLLELGSGPGTLWQENFSQLPAGWQVVLSDLSIGMAAEARRRLPLRAGRFSWAVLDVQHIPFKAAHFDAVLAIGLLDHIPARQKALDEAWRVLKPGGVLYASAGGASHLQEIEALVRPFLPDADFGGDPERFGLENGARLLSPWFSKVDLFRYSDVLVFKQIAPIAAYVLSEAETASQLVGEIRARFIQSLRDVLVEKGEIHVRIEKGMFAAYKEKSV